MLKKLGNKGRLVTIIAAAGLLVLAAFWLLTQSKRQQAYSQLRSQGLPTNAAELDKYYAVPAGTDDTTELWMKATTAVAAAPIEQQGAKLPIVGNGPTPIPERGQPWAELEDVRAFLKELQPQMELIHQAADAGGMARYPDDFRLGLATPMTNIQMTRTLARLLTLSAHVHVHSGEEQLALRDVRSIFAVSESLQESPVMISGLIRIAVHAIGCKMAMELLPQANWSDSDLKQLQIAILAAQFREELLTSLHGERAICLETIATTRGLLFRESNALKMIEILGLLTDAVKVSWAEAIAARQEIDREVLAIRGAGFITQAKFATISVVLPAVALNLDASMQAEARQNCAIAALAAHRYRLQHGTLPLTLADLTDFLPGDELRRSSLLIDPFDGQSLRFKIEGTRLLIYSIGRNLVDDGGQIDAEKPADGDVGYAVIDIPSER